MIYYDSQLVSYDQEMTTVKDNRRDAKNSSKEVLVHKSKVAAYIKKSMKELVGDTVIRKPLAFAYPEDKIKYSEDLMGNKIPQYPSNKLIPYKVNLVGEDGIMHEWVYSKTALKIKDGELELKVPGFEWTPSNPIVITQKEFELGFFLNFISPFCSNGANAGPRTYFELQDKARKAEVSALRNRNRVKVENAIYVDLSDEKLRILARAYLIKGEAELTADQIREQLRLIATVSDESLKTFLHDAKIDRNVKFKSTIQKAIDEGIVAKKSTGTKNYWYFVNQDDEKSEGAEICKISASMITKASEVLVEYLRDNDELFKAIEKKLR